MGSCRKFVADKSLEAASNGKYSLVRDGNEGKQRNCDESSTPSYRVHDSTSSRTAPWMGYASSGHEMGPATPFVTSRYYRAPELLCGSTEYDGAVDVWSMGMSYIEIIVPMTTYVNDLVTADLTDTCLLCSDKHSRIVSAGSFAIV